MSLSLRCSYPTALLAITALLGSCSQQGPATTPAASQGPATPAPSPQFPYGAKIDSLNGVAGHVFGQPLLAFPKMEAFPVQVGELLRSYAHPVGPPTGWFGKHRGEVPYQFYSFLDGQFSQFRAVGDAATLRAEALYLFGPGLAQGPQLFWEGSRARAVYSERMRGFEREGTLAVLSKPLEAAQQAQEKAKLRTDNAQ